MGFTNVLYLAMILLFAVYLIICRVKWSELVKSFPDLSFLNFLKVLNNHGYMTNVRDKIVRESRGFFILASSLMYLLLLIFFVYILMVLIIPEFS